MSMDISNIQGYSDVAYQNLLAEYTEKTNKSGLDLKNELMAYAAEGKNFDEAAALIRAELPELPAPIMERDITSYTAGALPSFGSNYMALITELSAEQRRQSADQKAIQTEMLIDNIEEQAEKIRTKAGLELAASVISGASQIASGIFTTCKITAGMGSIGDNSGAAMALNTKVGAESGIISGAGSILSGGFTFGASMVEADSKELEAEAERIRSTQDLLDKQDQALHELIQKSISTQDTIQQNINQTRTKILG